MSENWPVILQTCAAAASAVAACAAAWTAFEGPKHAAKLAENLRQENEAASEQRKLRMQVFSILMQERGTLTSRESLRALNLAVVASSRSQEVRTAIATFYRAASNREPGAVHAQNESYIAILNAMAADLGLASEITADDINRVFRDGGT